MATSSSHAAVIRKHRPWWIGWVEEIPGVNAQETSREAILESLRDVLREALEFNRLDALESAGPGAEELALNL
jgi:hypothetical protein